jgi:L-asparaginase
VEIVMSHAGANGALVQALVAQGVQGIVVAATGNGTVHTALLAELLKAQAGGVRVVRATRCANGRVLVTGADALPASRRPVAGQGPNRRGSWAVGLKPTSSCSPL